MDRIEAMRRSSYSEEVLRRATALQTVGDFRLRGEIFRVLDRCLHSLNGQEGR